MEKAKAAAARALELDDTLAEVHSALGLIEFLLEWDFEGAEQSLLRAIELNPGLAEARWWNAWLLSTLGRFPEAIEQMQMARRMSPVDPAYSSGLGVLYHFAGNDERAIPQLEATLELYPTHAETYQPLGMILCEHGEFERGIELLEENRVLSSDPPGSRAPLVYGNALAGRLDEARRLLGEMKERSKTEFVQPLAFVLAHVSLGQHDEAFEWLERAYEMRWVLLPGLLAVYPPYAPLRSDPRFDDLLGRIGFPES